MAYFRKQLIASYLLLADALKQAFRPVYSFSRDSRASLFDALFWVDMFFLA